MKVAVLGTGTMGAPMARRLADDGSDVVAFNRDRAKAERIGGGVTVADDPAAAVCDVEVAITMLSDAAATLGVAERMLPAMRRGAIWWQAGTIGLDGTEQCAMIAESHGVRFVDAPVLGTRQPAEAGDLVILASGPGHALDRLQPCFGAVGKKVLRLGDAGAGTRLKLVTNHWIGAVVAGLADTLRLAGALGVEGTTFLEAIGGGPLDLPYAQLKGRAMLEGDFTPSFALKHAAKDLGLVLDAADRHELDLALAPVIRERMLAAVEAGHGDEDLSAVVAAPDRHGAAGRA